MNNKVKQGVVSVGFLAIGVWVLMIRGDKDNKLDAKQKEEAHQQTLLGIATTILVWTVVAIVLFYAVKPNVEWQMPPLSVKSDIK